MKSKIKFAILLLLFFPTIISAQSSSMNLNGWHLAILTEGNIAQKISVLQHQGDYPQPVAHSAWGWNTGIETSFNFANFYGVSIGFCYGTSAQYKFDIPYANESNLLINYISTNTFQMRQFSIPVKFNIHVPIAQSHWVLNSSIGLNIQNINNAIAFSCDKSLHPDIYESSPNTIINKWSFHNQIPYPGENSFTPHFRSDIAEKRPCSIQLNFSLAMGISYQLPYNDLIRANVITNLSFNDRLYGSYSYPEKQTAGNFCYRHNTLGLELAYIHCF